MDDNEYFLGVADAVAKKSKDPSTKVGCVIVDNMGRIVSTGRNGFVESAPDSEWYDRGRDFKLSNTLHAELNAVVFSKRDIRGCVAYVTHPTCCLCLSVLKQSGVSRVIFREVSDEWKARWGTAEVFDLAEEIGVHIEEI